MLQLNSTINVFHGTNLFTARVIQYHGIWLDIQRKQTDFSQGFYVTFQYNQAKKWAIKRTFHSSVPINMLNKLKITEHQYLTHPDSRIPVCIAFDLESEKLMQLRGKIFPLPDDPNWKKQYGKWKEFVTNCRQGQTHPFDFVYGPIARSQDSNYESIALSQDKDQLSLNTQSAVSCLSRSTILIIKGYQNITA